MGFNCDFESRGESEEVIVAAMKEHLNSVHSVEWTEALRTKAGDLVRLVEAS